MAGGGVKRRVVLVGRFTSWLVKSITRRRVRGVYRGGFDLAAWRAFMVGMGKQARPPRDVRIEAVEEDGVRGSWFHPAEANGKGRILYLHGGAFVAGSVHIYREFVGRLAAAAGLSTFSVEYRLAPEHPHPAALDDAEAAHAWLARQHDGPLVIAGDSAGGNLALTLLLRLRGTDQPMPAAAVVLSPVTDLTCRGASVDHNDAVDPLLHRSLAEATARLYLGDHDPADPAVSPLFADLSGFPPLLIQVGTDEILLDDARGLDARAREAGVEVTLSEWPGMMHDFHFAAMMLAEGRQAYDEMGRFVRTHTHPA